MLWLMTMLDPDDSRPAYKQVADLLRAEIADGQLGPGQQLPTHKTLGAQYGVSVETAKRALRELQADGLIITRQGKGSFVRRGPGGELESTLDADGIAARLARLNDELESVKERLTVLEAGQAGE
jgi:GntR family transcriptional regulator